MILYNITVKVHSSICDAWRTWAIHEHIPDVMASGCFTGSEIFRLMETDETDGPTYAIQFRAESKSLYNLYIEKHAAAMRDKSFQKWGDKFIAFRSVMQIVD